MHGMHTVYFIKDLSDPLWRLVFCFVAAGHACACACAELGPGQWVGASSPRGAGAAGLLPERLQVPVSQLQAPARSPAELPPRQPPCHPCPDGG